MISSALRSLVVLAAIAAAAALGIVKPAAVSAPAPMFAALGEPLPFVDGAARARFARGREVATRRFAPSAGLGPNYNAVSCRNCHEKPVTGGGASRYRGVYVTANGPRAFVTPFAHHFTTESVPRTPNEQAAASVHAPSPFFGLGLLAEIPATEIARRADPNDRDGDGISGKVNFERGFIGRFGRKGQMASLQGFVRLALLDHMGVTTTPVSVALPIAEGDVPVEIATKDADGVADPELPQDDLADLMTFVALLAPPAPDAPTNETREGERLFAATGCAWCHVPSLKGPRGPVPAYTDLLLHDMGPALADGVAVGEASGSEFRTQPLWGIAAQGSYLHDGRAATIDEAIRAHGGEGNRAARRYEALDDGARRSLVAFLRSLGGADRTSEGLLAKEAPLAEVGAPGGPASPLAGEDAARFARGRAVFDRDFTRATGLGEHFNGDACRSCHFDPVIGGAGPSDVDVVRHAIVVDDATSPVRPPAGGDTMAQRFLASGARPSRDAHANLFERRQTPPLFGLALLDRIDESAIRAHADPTDADGDGIRGVVSVVTDGRVGRFGWKAQMPTLADFVRDAFAGELGMRTVDDASFADLMFFLEHLAPPPRAPVAADATAGERAFSSFSCASCHVPSLPARDGTAVPLYSDLLIHDVGPAGQKLVPQGSARGFRTPPLWGARATAPYLHDGSAETLDAAIRAHDGEAAKSRDRYLRAAPSDRAALLAFLSGL